MSDASLGYVVAICDLPIDQRTAIEAYVNSLTWENALRGRVCEAAERVYRKTFVNDETGECTYHNHQRQQLRDTLRELKELEVSES
jgi:hypothetical protein